MKLIVGLGNPGRQYQRTRHNIGFTVVRALSEQYGKNLRRKTADAAAGKIICDEEEVLLALPQTYMNRSGISVRQLLRRENIAIKDMLIVYDDVDLPLGQLRLRSKGGAGGHRGILSIISSIETNVFARLRCGIGRPEYGEVSDYVLSPFYKDERLRVDDMVDEAVSVCRLWCQRGIMKAMNECNKRG